ncbi:MAG TPA: hypothetical protein VMS96_01500 [Terriglobales bacterium]|nr:hypothetical protein [Terriglobales bacterium]
MITREELRYLAEIDNTGDSAISFYFQPETPKDRSHREETILLKDMVRDALRHAGRSPGHGDRKKDLHRILEKAEQWKGGSKAKVIFACGARGIWREYEVPPRLQKSQLVVNDRFHLKPLARLVEAFPRACVLLTDREHARFFTIRAGEIQEAGEIRTQTPRKARSDGFAGYDAGHAERHVENEAMKHFKAVSDRLQGLHQSAGCGSFLVGCREDTWPDIEPHLHPYVRQCLIGHFNVDPGLATKEQVLEHASRRLREHEQSQRQGMVREVLGEAHRNGRGAVGLRHVLMSLEKGEVQSLLLSDRFSAAASRCQHCGHMDIRMVRHCAVCGQKTREIDDVADALIGIAIRKGISVVYVRDEPEFEKAGNIGALLRFRADQSTPKKLAV